MTNRIREAFNKFKEKKSFNTPPKHHTPSQHGQPLSSDYNKNNRDSEQW